MSKPRQQPDETPRAGDERARVRTHRTTALVERYLRFERLAEESPEADSRTDALLERLLGELPEHSPGGGFQRRVLRTALEMDALLPWYERSPAWSPRAGLVRRAVRVATVLAVVVIGCGVGAAGTVLGTLLATLGFAGTAVWTSNLAIDTWIGTAKTLEVVLAAASTARETWLASASGPTIVVIAACVLVSATALIAMAQLKARVGDEAVPGDAAG